MDFELLTVDFNQVKDNTERGVPCRPDIGPCIPHKPSCKPQWWDDLDMDD